MRIGILTFHRAINYGAVMQAYSLQKRLKEDFPLCDVEIIDYNLATREFFKKKCPLVFLYRRSIKEGIQKYLQTKEFEKTIELLTLSKKMIGWKDEKVKRYIEKNYDMVIVGSDAVFNWNDIGIPNIYFLEDVEVENKLSYAASSHLQKYKNVNEKEIRYLSSALNQFKYIGVRDQSTYTFVENFLGGKNIVFHNCDPSIFLKMDFSEQRLRKKLEKAKFDFSKKTVFVMLMQGKYAKFVRRYYGKDTQIVALMDGNKEADVYLYNLNPFEWAHVFKYGDFLVTDYFHGTIFGLKNLIPVLSIDSSQYSNETEGYESKAKDLLYTRLDMPDLYINAVEMDLDDGYTIFKNKITQIENSFDKEWLTQRINNEAESYLSFKEALSKLMEK